LSLNLRGGSLDKNGTIITQWGKKGKGDGEIDGDQVSGMEMDNYGNIYIAEEHRIQKFAPSTLYALQGIWQNKKDPTDRFEIKGNQFIDMLMNQTQTIRLYTDKRVDAANYANAHPAGDIIYRGSTNKFDQLDADEVWQFEGRKNGELYVNQFPLNGGIGTGTTTYVLQAPTQAQVAAQAAAAKAQAAQAAAAKAQAGNNSSTHKSWVSLGGGGSDIAIDEDGKVWVIGGGNAIYIHAGSWQLYIGKGIRIAVAPLANGYGLPWVIDPKNGIIQNDNGRWQTPNGIGIDIAVDETTRGWVVSTNNKIYFKEGGSWKEYPGGGQGGAITVHPNGTPYIIGLDSKIYKGTGSGWHGLGGEKARDLAVGENGKIWIIGMNHLIYYHDGSKWHEYPGGMKGKAIAASKNGKVAIIDINGTPHVLK